MKSLGCFLTAVAAMFIVFIIVIVSIIAEDSPMTKEQTEAQTEQTTSGRYSDCYIISRIVSNINSNTLKVEYKVVVDEKYRDFELEPIAKRIKASDEDRIDYVFVSFYLQDMDTSGPNYAISIQTPLESRTSINYIE